MASVRIGRTDASSAVEGSCEELVRRGLTLKDLGVDAAKHGFVLLPRRWVVEVWLSQEGNVDQSATA
jgi:hypothetical protein